ncbi:MAG TPA: FliM/FliN family flagellar motor switch protein, partial [Pirellulales bacterium]|nr:FliM/FliN family flagellar motor switch protein [Pirellulales bacterium]
FTNVTSIGPRPIAGAPLRLRDFVAERAADEYTLTDRARDESALDGAIHAAELEVRIELGRTELSAQAWDDLRSGSVVTLDKRVSDPVDVMAGGRLVARGEVLVLDGKFCVRITEIVGGESNWTRETASDGTAAG